MTVTRKSKIFQPFFQNVQNPSIHLTIISNTKIVRVQISKICRQSFSPSREESFNLEISATQEKKHNYVTWEKSRSFKMRDVRNFHCPNSSSNIIGSKTTTWLDHSPFSQYEIYVILLSSPGKKSDVSIWYYSFLKKKQDQNSYSSYIIWVLRYKN